MESSFSSSLWDEAKLASLTLASTRGEVACVPSSSSKAGPLVEVGLGGGPLGESKNGREVGAASRAFSFTKNSGSGAGIFFRVRGSASSGGGTGGDSGEAV